MKIYVSRENECANVRKQLDYAVKELRNFLEEFTTVVVTEQDAKSDASVKLFVDEELESHCYEIHGDGSVLHICGGSASAVLCGIYEALSQAGILFEATGYKILEKFDIYDFLHVKKSVKPKCRLRGIRQHINFPMDISSYTLEDAKKYIRALARMQYNAITFHSYGGQWHATEPDNPNSHAGHFFYGQHHPITTKDSLTASRIHNRKQYCIPEAEAIYDNEKSCGEYAQYWLREVMKTVKEVGMELTLSVEMPFDEADKNNAMLSEVCRAYPQIDTLELITYENGDEGHKYEVDGLAPETMKECLVNIFGERILEKDGRLPGVMNKIPAVLPGSIVALKRIFEALDNKEHWMKGLEKKPALRAGIYVTYAESLKLLWPILCKCLPDGVTKSLLPAHGAVAVTKVMEEIGIDENDWQNTMFYSWAEFDGNMYIQQMSTDGLEKIVTMSSAESVYGICINHWRTSENKMAISYWAKNAVKPMKTVDFYGEYAKMLKIGKTDHFVETCDRLAKLDTHNRDQLFNIGFCIVACWVSRDGINLPRCYPKDAQMYAVKEYENLAVEFAELLQSAGTNEAIALLRLLQNRCTASALHIQSMLKLDEICQIYDYEKKEMLSEKQKDVIHEICTQARDYAQQYVHLYGEILPDRGCQGQIVSYYETIPVFIDAVERYFDDSIIIKSQEVFDAPPVPDVDAK